MKKITSELEYTLSLAKVHSLMKIGEENLTDQDAENITALASMIQAYEKLHLPFPMPTAATELVELEVFEKL